MHWACKWLLHSPAAHCLQGFDGIFKPTVPFKDNCNAHWHGVILAFLLVFYQSLHKKIIFVLISNHSRDVILTQYLEDTLFTWKSNVGLMWNFDSMSHKHYKGNWGKFHGVWLTYELLRVDCTNWKYRLFRTGANLHCYGYKCARFIKVKVRIILKCHNLIENK